MKITTEEFIEQSNAAHGSFYDYTKTVYTGALDKVTITCPHHGDFNQEASSHKRGTGCPTCGQLKTNSKNARTQEEFLTRAKEIHGNTYDYTKVVYTSGTNKVDILCKFHGVFLQSPNSHLKGSGCAACNKTLTHIRNPTTQGN